MKMSAAEIQDILEENPDMTYEDVKKQAITAGVNLEQFNEAWHTYLMRTRKPPASKIWAEIYIFVLIIVTALAFDTVYWNFVLSIQNKVLMDVVGKFGIFTSGILIMHLSSKFAGGKASIFSTTKLSLFLLLVTYLAHYASLTTTTVTYIIVLFGGVLLGFFVLFAIARTYNIDVFRTLVCAALFVIIMSITVEFTMGLTTFRGYFAGSGIKDVTLESAVDIAEEKTEEGGDSQ